MEQLKVSSEELIRVLQGTSFALYEAKKDKEKYENYKKGELKSIDEETNKDLKILDILERLGYSMNELGTYLYKDLIKEVCDEMKDVSTRRDMDKCRILLSELTNIYSNLYHYIAREWKEMGIKTFHLYIGQATERIDKEKIDQELSKKIYGNNPKPQDYGLHAFQIAAYTLNKYSYDNTKKYQQPKVKKLSNMPNNKVSMYNINLLAT